jgi:hypothetical protein
MPTEEERKIVRQALVKLRDRALPRVKSQELVEDGIWEDLIGYWKFAMNYGLKPGMAEKANPATEQIHSWQFVYHCADAALTSLTTEADDHV